MGDESGAKIEGFWGGEGIRSGSGYSLAWEDKAPNILPCDDPELPAAHDTEKKRLISSLALLATSLLPIRETNPFTADVITASGSNCAGTNKHRLSGAGGGPREA